MSETASSSAPIVVAALYRFTALDDPAAFRPALESVGRDGGVTGTLILAPEGVNGTIAGSRSAIDAVLTHLRTLPGCAGLEHKESYTQKNPFLRLKVRLKREIVTMGVEDIDPASMAGTYVDPEDWNTLLDDPNTVVIDTRNDYEVRIGTFEGAVNPETASFREFPDWFRSYRAQNPLAKVAMFCTGGIRCEKSTAFLKQEGLEDVYHLKGGILKYLEKVPPAESRWQGECFVFDQRVSVTHGLERGSYDLCHGCRRPISDADKAHQDYIPGIACPACAGETSSEQKRRFAERQKQISLARKRGEGHLGQAPAVKEEEL